MNKNFKVRETILVVVWLFLFVCCAQAKRLIPDDNLAYPVLITLKSGNGTSIASGSGFYLNTATASYLVTAKHVLAAGFLDPKTNRVEAPDLIVEVLSYPKDLSSPQRNLLRMDFKTLRESGDAKAHQTRDVAVVKVATVVSAEGDVRKMAFSAGITALETAATGLLGVNMDGVRKFDQVLVGNDAILYGYPASLGLPDTHQFDPLRPLLRKGMIAGEDAQTRSLIIDGPVYRGNSGGPVVEIDVDFPLTHYYVVGVVTQFIPLTERAPDFQLFLNSGYSVAEPMDFVLELVQ